MKHITTLFLTLVITALWLTACGSAPLTLDQTSLSLTVGDSAELSAGDATKVSWQSSDSAVVTVNAGKLSAKSAGSAVVTASLENGEKATCAVTVTDKLINLITLDVKSARIEVGKTIQLTASYAPADATKTALSWRSSDASVATVDNEGYVTGIGKGAAQITCQSENGIEAACTVNVGAKELPTTAPTAPPATQAPTQAVKPTETTAAATEKPADQPSGSRSDGFVFPESSERYLSQSEVAARLSSMSGSPVSDSFSQDAVNEIFARHGYVFRTPSIRAYYEAQSWYHSDPSYDGTLSAIEQSNIALFNHY
ncbi:Ig-like domain-containing protein [Ruminococcus sp.]|uniref:Ig-like domain-containing protein n=1 Tax=Ruminococcus sp. TaxID=41978 RepID=UPI00388DD021